MRAHVKSVGERRERAADDTRGARDADRASANLVIHKRHSTISQNVLVAENVLKYEWETQNEIEPS